MAAAPGGSNDIVGRILAEAVGQILGQPVIVENRAGAGSVIGSEAAARAPADGYTLMVSSSSFATTSITQRVPWGVALEILRVLKVEEVGRRETPPGNGHRTG